MPRLSWNSKISDPSFPTVSLSPPSIPHGCHALWSVRVAGALRVPPCSTKLSYAYLHQHRLSRVQLSARQPDDPGCPAGGGSDWHQRPGREPTVEEPEELLRNTTSSTTEYAVPLLVKEGPLLVEEWRGRDGRDGLICSCQSNLDAIKVYLVRTTHQPRYLPAGLG